MTIMQEMTIKHNLIYQVYMEKRTKLYRDFDFGRISEDDFERMEEHYRNVYHSNLLRFFRKLTWQEQIYFCIATDNPFMVERLDAEQLATMKIVA